MNNLCSNQSHDMIIDNTHPCVRTTTTDMIFLCTTATSDSNYFLIITPRSALAQLHVAVA